MSTTRCSLHHSRITRACDHCGETVPAGGDYWRVRAMRHNDSPTTLRVCVLCHALYDLPSDGWERPADGRQTFPALTPAAR